MKKPTKEQIAEWKKKYSSLFILSSEGRECIIFSPFDDIKAMKMAFAALGSDDQLTFVDAILNNCFLWGDESLKQDDAFKMSIAEQIEEIVNVPEYEIEKAGNILHIHIEGKTFKVRPFTRVDIKEAQKRSKMRKPFETNEVLLKRTAQDDLTEVMKDGRTYFALLLAIMECKEQKEAEVKKFW